MIIECVYGSQVRWTSGVITPWVWQPLIMVFCDHAFNLTNRPHISMVYTLIDHKIASYEVQTQLEPWAMGEWFHCNILNILWHRFMLYKSVNHGKNVVDLLSWASVTACTNAAFPIDEWPKVLEFHTISKSMRESLWIPLHSLEKGLQVFFDIAFKGSLLVLFQNRVCKFY